MRILISILFSLSVLHAASLEKQILSLENTSATIDAENIQIGMSGYIIRSLDSTHNTIIANVTVQSIDTSKHALLQISPYDGIRQTSLPSGKWKPMVGDRVLIATDYDRGLLLTSNDNEYSTVSKSIQNITWVHPDLFATYLSREGHPTPLKEDIHNYCTANSIGLLYVQSSDNLFTLDCKNFALLNITPFNINKEKASAMTPFYSRIPSIRSALWGEGSNKIEDFDSYFLEQIALNNPNNIALYTLFKAKFSNDSALLRNFQIKE